MKSWKRRGSILLLSCLFSCGCGQSEEVSEKNQEVIPIVFTPMAEETPTVESFLENGNFIIVEPEPTIEITVEKEPIDIDVDACNAMNRKLTRDMESGASLFCLEEDAKVAYFVNQNKDYYLYRMEKGEVELVVELPVKEVYPWDGSVYFMIESYDKYKLEGKKDGDIYRYIPKTGVVELVYAAGAIKGSENHKMSVNEQGIHFNYSETVSREDGIIHVKIYSYSLPFGSTEPVKDITKMGKPGWKDYYFSYEFFSQDTTTPANVALVSRTNGINDIIPLEIGQFQYCVVNDTIYSTSLGSSSLSLFDLESREVQKYDFRTIMVEANLYLDDEKNNAFGGGMEEICFFTMTENGKVIWATDNEYLYRMDTESRTVEYFKTKDGSRRIENLYTDGEQVYALYASERTGISSLVRFCMEEIELIDRENVVAVEYLVPEGGL